jgi:hypothetical protein
MPDKQNEASQANDAAVAVIENARSDSGRASPADTEITEAAQKDANLAERRWHRMIAYWAIASIVGMTISASFKLYLLSTVGIANPLRWQEILATGLVIGAGTKPLHDLTGIISAKKGVV